MNTLKTSDTPQTNNNLVTSISDLSGRLCDLEENIEKLESVLSPILIKQEQPCCASGVGPGNVEVATSDLRDTIKSYTRHVNNLIDKVSILIGRVDL